MSPFTAVPVVENEVLRAEGLVVGKPPRVVLQPLHLSLPGGAALLILAPDGGGKTDLLRTLAGLRPPDSGRVLHLGEDPAALPPPRVRALRRRVRMVFRQGVLVHNLTLLENAALPLLVHERVGAADARDRALRILDSLGIASSADLYPAEAPPGVARRAHLAAALVVEPAVLVLDQPLSDLDREAGALVADRLRAERGRGVALVIAATGPGGLERLEPQVLLLEGGTLRPSDTMQGILAMLQE
ncbi:MAG: ATP-binding cassette domain-containing protein [Planctomycetales bacterium]|nr:ATP-binding cassette domain-containing protein [Planctomycetales bacterium]